MNRAKARGLLLRTDGPLGNVIGTLTEGDVTLRIVDAPLGDP